MCTQCLPDSVAITDLSLCLHLCGIIQDMCATTLCVLLCLHLSFSPLNLSLCPTFLSMLLCFAPYLQIQRSPSVSPPCISTSSSFSIRYSFFFEKENNNNIYIYISACALISSQLHMYVMVLRLGLHIYVCRCFYLCTVCLKMAVQTAQESLATVCDVSSCTRQITLTQQLQS